MNKLTKRWLRAWSFSLLLLPLSSCYEEVEGCVDPDATNYDLSTDEDCGGCCTYPELSLQIDHLWNAEGLDADSVRTDGAGNRFVFDRLRLYLGQLELITDEAILGPPTELQEVGLAEDGDTLLTEINVNAFLLDTESESSSSVGNLPIGNGFPTALNGIYGLPAELQSVVPATAPSGSVLRTQAGLLNFNDGRGYVQAKLDFRLEGDTTNRSLLLYGSEPFVLSVDTLVDRRRYDNLTLTLEADYAPLFEGVDLSGNSETAAADLRDNFPALLRITGY